ncbi:MAG: hypothetical protein AB7G28_12820 [Pirellulales bacterium]
MKDQVRPTDRFSWSLWGLVLVAACVWLPGRILPAVVGVVALIECTRSYARAKQVLPERVAAHFNFALLPDQWMNCNAYLALMGGLSFLLVFVLPIGFLLLPVAQANMKGQRLALWAITLSAGMMMGMNELLVRANLSDPVRLSSMVWALLGLFIVAINCWALSQMVPW